MFVYSWRKWGCANPMNKEHDMDTYHWLVFGGHLCDLQGLFSEIDNLHTVNRIELQLMIVISNGDMQT